MKENLFNATGAKRRLSGPELWATKLHLVATNHSDDIWVAGNLAKEGTGPSDVVLARLDSEGAQHWAIALETEQPLELTGLAVTNNGSLVVGGTIEGVDGSAVYLAGFDASGVHQWDRIVYGDGALYGGGIIALENDTLVLACRQVGDDGASTLLLLTGDDGGESVRMSVSEYPAEPGKAVLALDGPQRLRLVLPDGATYQVHLEGRDAQVIPALTGEGIGVPRALVLESGGDYATTVLDGSLWLDGPNGAESLGLPGETLHTLQRRLDSGSPELVWVVRDSAQMAWQPYRRLLGDEN